MQRRQLLILPLLYLMLDIILVMLADLQSSIFYSAYQSMNSIAELSNVTDMSEGKITGKLHLYAHFHK